jgi:nickel/cobalt exporter
VIAAGDQASGQAEQNDLPTTERPDGSVQTFAFTDKGGYLESTTEIPEPDEFMAP